MRQTNLTTVIEMKDKDGRVVSRKEVATYQGLLAKAHDEGLRKIETELIQAPTKENGETAIVKATVRTQRGTFSGIGDANPGNVNRRIAAHVLRMAETRAKARALRDAVNIGVVALEELGELATEELGAEEVATSQGNNGTNGHGTEERRSAPPERPRSYPSHGNAFVASEAQRRLLFRLANDRGVKPDEARAWLERELGVSMKTLSRADASRAIDRLQGKSNGNGAAPAGGAS